MSIFPLFAGFCPTLDGADNTLSRKNCVYGFIEPVSVYNTLGNLTGELDTGNCPDASHQPIGVEPKRKCAPKGRRARLSAEAFDQSPKFRARAALLQ